MIPVPFINCSPNRGTQTRNESYQVGPDSYLPSVSAHYLFCCRGSSHAAHHHTPLDYSKKQQEKQEEEEDGEGGTVSLLTG